jgi:hypothetical protein
MYYSFLILTIILIVHLFLRASKITSILINLVKIIKKYDEICLTDSTSIFKLFPNPKDMLYSIKPLRLKYWFDKTTISEINKMTDVVIEYQIAHEEK